MSRVRAFIELPEFKNQSEHRMAVLLNYAVLLVFFALLALSLVFIGEASQYAIIEIMLWMILSKIFLQVGKLKAASYAFCGGLFVSFIINVWLYNGLDDYGASMAILVVLVAGIFIGRKLMLLMTSAIILYWLGILMLMERGLYQSNYAPLSVNENSVLLIIILLSISIILFLVLRDKEQAISLIEKEISQRKEMQIQLARQTRMLDLLHDVRTLLAREVDLDGIYRVVAGAVEEVFGYDLFSIYSVDVQANLFRIREHDGTYFTYDEIEIGDGVFTTVYRSKKPIYLADTRNAPEFIGDKEIISEICMPLLFQDEVVGILNLESANQVLDEHDYRFMIALAEYVEVAIARVGFYEERQQHEVLYRTLFDQTNDGIFLIDMEDNYIRVNQRATEIVGYTEQELMGLDALDLVVQDERVKGKNKQKAALAGENLPVYERLFKHKDGSIFPVEISLSLVSDYQGNPLYYQSVVRDISERKALEQQLVQERNLLQSLIDTVPAGIYAKDTESRFLIANRAVLDEFGVTNMEQLVGRTIADFLPEQYAMASLENDQYVIDERRTVLNFETEHFRKDGTTYIALLSKAPMLDQDGTVVGIAVSLRDISDLKQAEAATKQLNDELENRVRQRTSELEAANQELEAFAYTVSHDLRAPLRGIDGFASILAEEAGGALSADAKKHIDRIHENIQRMNALINGLLDFSRLGQLSLHLTEISLTDLVQDTWRDLTHERSGRDEMIEFSVAELGDVNCDPVLVRQVFINLLGNSIKFTRLKKQVKISVGIEDRNGQKVFFVRDNGVGFDPKYGNKLFGVFERLHGADEYEGQGVGLAVVRRIVHRHGGEVWVESTPDEGATFFFTLEMSLNKGMA